MTPHGAGLLASWPTHLHHELTVAQALARKAGALVLEYRLSTGLDVEQKTAPDDLVTAADKAASALIAKGIREEFPTDALLSEEEPDDPSRLGHSRVWSIDPIDGTRNFVQGRSGYAVSIALTIAGQPALGAIYAPASGQLYAGGPELGLYKNGAAQPAQQAERSLPYRLLLSESEQERELHAYRLSGTPSGSAALKLAQLAFGEADATFSVSPRSEWDIAAGHALLLAAGGDLQRRSEVPVRYNAPVPHLEQGIVAGVGEALPWLISELKTLGVPTAHLGVRESDPAWALLSEEQRHWAQESVLCLRHTQGEILALLAVRGSQEGRALGSESQLALLRRDVVRAGLLPPTP